MRPPDPPPDRLPRPTDLLHGTALLVVVAAAVVLLGAAARLAPSWLEEADGPISEALRRDDAGIWGLVTHLGSSVLLFGFAVATAAAAWRRCRALAIVVPLAALAAVLVGLVLKLIVDRARPSDSLVDTALGSFPSGHTLQAAVLFGLLPPVVYVLSRRRWAFWWSVGVLFVAVPAVAISRIVLGAHWPSDVIASVAIGSLLLVAADAASGSGWNPTRCVPHAAVHAPPRSQGSTPCP